MSNDAFPVLGKSDILEIKFKGSLELEVKTVLEGKSFLIECNPQGSHNSEYKWFINDNEIVSENGKTVKIEHFIAAYNNSVIKCMGEDNLGKLKLLKLQLDSSKITLLLPSNIVQKMKKIERKSKSKNNNDKKKMIFTCIAGKRPTRASTSFNLIPTRAILCVD